MIIEKNSTISKRYAKSLFDLSKNDEALIEDVTNGLRNVETILKNSNDLYTAMINPIISAKDKEKIINIVFEKDTNEIIRNTLKLLINKNRFDLVYSIINIFFDLVDEFNRTVKVEIICATELDENKKLKIQEQLKEVLDKKVQVNYEIDEEIIAGLICKIKDDVIDASVQYKIEKLKQKIIK